MHLRAVREHQLAIRVVGHGTRGAHLDAGCGVAVAAPVGERRPHHQPGLHVDPGVGAGRLEQGPHGVAAARVLDGAGELALPAADAPLGLDEHGLHGVLQGLDRIAVRTGRPAACVLGGQVHGPCQDRDRPNPPTEGDRGRRKPQIPCGTFPADRARRRRSKQGTRARRAGPDRRQGAGSPRLASAGFGTLGCALRRRDCAPGGRAGLCARACPVICVGNLNAGGTGKTPTVIHLIERLGDGRACRLAEVMAEPRRKAHCSVDERKHMMPHDVGDEPLLLVRIRARPGWRENVRSGRARGGRPRGHVWWCLDDGFQNPGVEQGSLSLIVVDAEVGFGNGRVIPAGPLRETVLRRECRRADALVLAIGDEAAQAGFQPAPGSQSADGAPGKGAAGGSGDRHGLGGLCRFWPLPGIGRPAKFFADGPRSGGRGLAAR